MKTFLEKINLEKIRAFYMGRTYPAVVAAIVLIGSITATEYYLNIVHTLLFIGAFCICRSIRPALVSICTYIYQISVKYAPQYPTNSDFYYTGWRFPVLIVLATVLIASAVYFLIKNLPKCKFSFAKTPLLLPLTAFSAVLMLGGAFSGAWTLSSLVFALANIFVYVFIFYLVYYGLKEEKSEDIASYFAYVCMLAALVVSCELVHLLITSDTIFVDGAIIKDQVALGWGIWNLVAVSLAITIPACFYGVQKNRYPWLYFAVATLAYVMSVLTMSRNALVFSTLAYVACVIISCFVGKHKRTFRIITVAGIVAVGVLLILLWGRLQTVLGDYFERGFSNNGRFNLWLAAFDNFLEAPIFGKGFYALDVDTAQFGFLPKQAHNTVFQLLSATGIVGISAYGYYRVNTLIYVFKRPNLTKLFMALVIAVLLFESLLDNFVFNFYPVFYYSIAMAIIVRSDEEEREKLSADLKIHL